MVARTIFVDEYTIMTLRFLTSPIEVAVMAWVVPDKKQHDVYTPFPCGVVWYIEDLGRLLEYRSRYTRGCAHRAVGLQSTALPHTAARNRSVGPGWVPYSYFRMGAFYNYLRFLILEWVRTTLPPVSHFWRGAFYTILQKNDSRFSCFRNNLSPVLFSTHFVSTCSLELPVELLQSQRQIELEGNAITQQECVAILETR